jgi:hypothetical protein
LAAGAIALIEKIAFGRADSQCAIRFPALRSAFAEYLTWQRGLSPARREVERAGGQEAWALTGFAAQQRDAGANVMANLSPAIRSCLRRTRTLVDLGCGDGRATSSFVQSIRPFCTIQTVVLVDQSRAAIRDAQRALTTSFESALALKPMCGDLGSPEIWLDTDPSRTLALASGSLHELDDEAKRGLLRRVKASTTLLILFEFLVDHDSPRCGSVELIERSAVFYEALVQNAYSTVLGGRLRRKIIGAFLLGELVDIWVQPYAQRRNYHLDRRGWTALLTGVGFELLVQQEILMNSGDVTTGIFLAG